MPSKQKIVISASRRTDIPAFYMDWFMEQVNAGQFECVNPYNKKTYYVPASPEQVSTIVFWSKNFDTFINQNYWKALIERGYNLFFNFTINSPDLLLEPNLPDLEKRFEQAKFLSENFGGDSINWRFDPLVIYKKNNRLISPLTRFEEMTATLSGFGVKRCITSFVDMYAKVKQRLRCIGNTDFLTLSTQEQADMIRKMAAHLETQGMTLHLCCEKDLFDFLPDNPVIKESACIDNRFLENLFGDSLSFAQDSGQRKSAGCNCKKSYDIGSYDLQPCFHNCIYCYANPKP